MSQKEDTIKILFQRFADNLCNAEELKQLYDHIEKATDAEIYELMNARYENTSTSENAEKVDWDYLFQQIVKRRSQSLFKRLVWLRIAVAAFIVLVLVAAIYYQFNNKSEKPIKVAKTTVLNDVAAPETNRATITLADGKKIYLDSAENGSLIAQGNVNVIKLSDGKIAYNGSASEVVYNTLTNPRGSKVIDMRLADGSRIWLNAGSAVTYPVAFVGNERTVSIKGEAYFEVEKNAGMPFKVVVNQMEVTVLGTHFNVNAYGDEPAIRTTLLEGSVKVTKGSAISFLKTGQQAMLDTTGSLNVIKDVDIEGVMAWKSGMFEFDDAELPVIMRQISRWYNREIVYDKQPGKEKYWGAISKQVPLSDVLKMLEVNGNQFAVNGNKIIVKPKF